MAERADRLEKQGSAYLVLSEGGKELARFTGEGAEAKARERLRQIEAAKAAKGDEVDAPQTVRRYDRGKLTRKPRRDSSTGALLVDASVTRAPAVFRYQNADGSVRREFRPADQVFSKDNLELMGRSPVTLGHPRERVTTKNIKRLSIGHASGAVEVRDSHGFVPLVIDDEGGIEALNGGLNQTSCGYDCDLVMKSGVFTDDAGVDHPFDAIQTNHRNNHIALCHEGRAGTTRVHLDSLDRLDAYQIGDDEMPNTDEKRREDLMTQTGEQGRLKLDGYEIEMSVDKAGRIADALAKSSNQTSEATARGDALEAERDDLKAKRDAMEAERDDLKAKLDAAEKAAESEEDMQKRVDERIAFNECAMKHFDEKEWIDLKTKSESDIKKAAIAKDKPDLSLDGKSDDYIDAAYDYIKVPSRSDCKDLANAALTAASRSDDKSSEDQKRVNEFIKRDDEAWRNTIPGGITPSGKTIKPEPRARF